MTQDKLERGYQRLSRERLAQWRRLGYGMFLHFGMSTFLDEVLDGNAQRANPYRPVPLKAKIITHKNAKFALIKAKPDCGEIVPEK